MVGKTDKNSSAVADRMVAPAHLFATYFHALGIDPQEEYYAGARPVSLVDSSGKEIEELFT